MEADDETPVTRELTAIRSWLIAAVVGIVALFNLLLALVLLTAVRWGVL